MRILSLAIIFFLGPPAFAENPLCKGKIWGDTSASAACPSDHRMVDALKASIARSLCLRRLDVACLAELESDIRVSSCAGISFDLESRHWTGNLDFKCALERSRKFAGSKAELIFNEWLTPDSEKQLVDMTYNFVDLKRDKSNQDTLGLIQSGIALSPLPATQIISNFMAFAKALSGRKSVKEFEKARECGLAAINIGAQITANGTCIPDYSLQQPIVRSFLLQDAAYQDREISCKNTCEYYAKLLVGLAVTNNLSEVASSAKIKGRPTCHADGAASFNVGIREPGHPAGNLLEQRAAMGHGQNTPLNSFTQWSVQVFPSKKETKVEMSPDQPVPDLADKPFEKIVATYTAPSQPGDFSGIKMEMVQNHHLRSIPHPLQIVNGSEQEPSGHDAVKFSLTMAAKVLRCCNSPVDRDKCFEKTLPHEAVASSKKPEPGVGVSGSVQ